ncbi:GCN5 family acetyltransferase [Paenibacillus swuensis]|uniref:GCN5 family acetyltransferase n=1 Tax=Paenibacillus swuensis TaxID=1178515 RepID=A0A172TEJ3_9BACL|nr:GNAT family N-acetyltransferase [Paenibacillus swuensis]ANE45430.1 GCN5 family acetyltransferase [Paenibacillus swuensis]
MLLRTFQLSDYAPVTELLSEVLTESCYDETMEAFARQLKWDSDLVIVAESDEEIVGIIIGTIDNNQGYYYRIAVGQAYQRKGIGKALIANLKQKFVQRKVSRILVSVDSHNEFLLPLYESLGYRASDFLRSFKKLSIITG